MSYFHLEALKRFLTVKEAAFVLNVSVDTISTCCKENQSKKNHH